jgi:hypothetical protein
MTDHNLTDLEQRAAEISAFPTREAYEAAQAAMLAAEGLWYVDGVYFADHADDAVRRRRWAAERAVDVRSGSRPTSSGAARRSPGTSR